MATAIAGLLGTILGAIIGVVSLELRSRREQLANRRDALRARFLDWISTQRHIAANLIQPTSEKVQIEAEMVLAAARLLGASDASASEMAAFQRDLVIALKAQADGGGPVTPSSVAEELSNVVSMMSRDLADLR